MALTEDEINEIYFTGLKQQLKKKQSRLRIGENVFPTAIAPKDYLKDLPWLNFSEIFKDKNRFEKIATGCTAWIKKAQAGGGTSILREKYLRRMGKQGKLKLGAKGTDLFTESSISLAEVQLLQAIRDITAKSFKDIFYQDLISRESQEAIKNLWLKPSKIKPSLTYEELTKNLKGFHHWPPILQKTLPTLNEKEEFSTDRMAPGGHGFFAFETLLTAAREEGIPAVQNKATLVVTIGNGEDLGSSPHPLVVGWMVAEKIPIAMITTEKTEIDLKGGQIAIVKSNDGPNYITLIEQAQAKQEDQLELFEKIGIDIKVENQMSFFNTNTAMFNYETLIPKLKALVKKIGEEAFKEAIIPTLIENKKIQEGRTYTQLEGAMGSSLLNLDRTWRLHFGEPLVHIVNIERKNRTQFFSPIKTAFDFFMLFHSNRFSFDEKTFRLVDHRPGILPSVHLPHAFYQDVENIFEAFKGVKILELEHLHIEGYPVIFKNVELAGKIKIHNQSGEPFQWTDKNLNHCDVVITPLKEVKIKPF